MDSDAAEIFGLITEASLCGDCIAHKVGAPRWQVENTLRRLGSIMKITTRVDRCDECLKMSVVHRLG